MVDSRRVDAREGDGHEARSPLQSGGVDDGHVVVRQTTVGRDDGQVFSTRLRDQQAVEGVTVMQRQVRQRARDRRPERGCADRPP